MLHRQGYGREETSKRLADPIVGGLQIQAELFDSTADLACGPVKLRLLSKRFPALLEFSPFILRLHRAEMNLESNLVASALEIIGKFLKV